MREIGEYLGLHDSWGTSFSRDLKFDSLRNLYGAAKKKCQSKTKKIKDRPSSSERGLKTAGTCGKIEKRGTRTMNDVNTLIEELRTLITTSELSAAERFQVAMNRMAGFLAEAFGGEMAEVAILWNRGESLSFLWPDFLAAAKELSIKSTLPIAANIFRSGRSFLDNRLIKREHMVEYEFVKESDGGSRLIWKMMGAAITVEGERLGVVQISRKRSAYNDPGPDFTPADLDLLEKLTVRLGPFLKAVIPY